MNANPWDDVVPGVSNLTNTDLDRRLEEAVIENLRSEKIICCFLSEVRERRAYREFGFSSIYDYARERFGFKERKTRYLLFLGRKVQELPQIREALRSGRLGWCKATRIASVATVHDETTWLDSALSLSVQELDRRIKDGTDRLASMLHLWLTEDQRVLWENGLEVARRVAGAEISPSQAFEYMVAEFVATWANGGGPVPERESDPEPKDEAANASIDPAGVDEDCEPRAEANHLSLLPGAEDEASKGRFRSLILERDQWKCTYPGCNARRELHVHHIQFRSHGGGDEPGNGTVLCAFHHALLHAGQIAVEGRAPRELEWTPPKLMREVLERRRNRPELWVGELEVWEWPCFVSGERADAAPELPGGLASKPPGSKTGTRVPVFIRDEGRFGFAVTSSEDEGKLIGRGERI